jgi:hypothetical protein
VAASIVRVSELGGKTPLPYLSSILASLPTNHLLIL